MRASLNGVLVAVDGSRDAASAIRAATELSDRTGAELHVIHVWPGSPARAFPALSHDYHLAYEREAGGVLQQQVERVLASGGTVARAHLRRGRPAEEIVSLAKELGIDLVVVGSRGLGRIRRLTMGSVAEGAVQRAPCPTLVVPDGAEAWPPARLVIGDDGSEEAGRAGEMAARLYTPFGARATLVRIYRPVYPSRARKASHAPSMVRTSAELLRRGEESLEKRAGGLEEILGTRPETRVATGDPVAILQEITEEDAGAALVAVGSRGLGALWRLALGSTSTDALRALGGPVLVVPYPGGARR